jgi:hypothetical protein
MKVEVLDLSGKLVKSFDLNKSVTGPMQTYLSIGSVPSGNYLLKVTMKGWSGTEEMMRNER